MAYLAVSDLEAHLGRTLGAADETSAEAAVAAAVALIDHYLGFDIEAQDDVAAGDIAVCTAVGARIAAQWFTNPQDRASYSGVEGMSWTASPQMLSAHMAPADRIALHGLQMKFAPGIA
jgi:hypothetical protein